MSMILYSGQIVPAVGNISILPSGNYTIETIALSCPLMLAAAAGSAQIQAQLQYSAGPNNFASHMFATVATAFGQCLGSPAAILFSFPTGLQIPNSSAIVYNTSVFNNLTAAGTGVFISIYGWAR